MQAVLDRITDDIKGGSLEFICADGTRLRLGREAPCTAILLKDARLLSGLLLDPGAFLGEGYVDGLWAPADGDLRGALQHGALLLDGLRRTRVMQKIRPHLPRQRPLHPVLPVRRSLAPRYEPDTELFATLLGAELHYSSAWFEPGSGDLDAAQLCKCRRLGERLALPPGAQVVELGCGWGGVSLHLAQHFGLQVTGIARSDLHLQAARLRAAERGLRERAVFRREDAGDAQPQVDAILSLGMLEHLARPRYDALFRHVFNRLKPGGRMILHAIVRGAMPPGTDSWSSRFLFPGARVPALSDVLASAEFANLRAVNLERWSLAYAATVGAWSDRLARERRQFAARRGERTCRSWELSLLACEASLRQGELAVMHLEFRKPDEALQS